MNYFPFSCGVNLVSFEGCMWITIQSCFGDMTQNIPQPLKPGPGPAQSVYAG